MISDCELPAACLVVDCAPAVIVVLPGCDWNNNIALVKTKNVLCWSVALMTASAK